MNKRTVWKARVLEIKWICFAAMLVLLITGIVQGMPSREPFDRVKTAVLSAAETKNMTEGDSLMIRRLYELDQSAYQGAALYYPASNMAAEELLLVQLADAGQKDQVLSAVQDRLQAQKDNFEGYGVEQTDMLSRSITEAKGNYILFVVAEDPEPVRAAFLEAL
ncbi:MAG: DUF4358 domain-containing protein [Eubacterium sp.]|nr:DUF4358 domain-containing protein [Eubacterium sp.]